MMPIVLESGVAPMEALLPLFERSPHHHIARSACLGLVPCRAFVDSMDSPTAAMLVLKRFGVGFVAGDARHAESFLSALQGWHPDYDIFDPPLSWHPALNGWSRESYGMIRYGTSFDWHGIDLLRLRAIARPPEGCYIQRYDQPLLEQALSMVWSQDHIGAFLSIGDFLSAGFGFALVREGTLLSGCSCFCNHPDGYEIQVDTHPDAQQKGYAACVSAAFLLETFARGKIPYWDAGNMPSLKLAQKLGFQLTCGFVAWKLTPADGTNRNIAASKTAMGECLDGQNTNEEDEKGAYGSRALLLEQQHPMDESCEEL